MSTLDQIEIPETAIAPADRQDFDEMRRDTYTTTKSDEDARRIRLTELADLVSAKQRSGHAPSIHELVLRSLESQTFDVKPKGVSYRFTLDDQGSVVGIEKIKRTQQSKESLDAAHRAADRIGWGHKQNWSQTRVDEKRLPTRRIHF